MSIQVTLRPAVQWFAEQIEIRLQANDHKTGWEDWPHEEHVAKLDEEKGELLKEVTPPACSCREANCVHVAEQAYWHPDPERVIKEAADLAALAMMFADKARGCPDGPSGKEKAS